MEISKDNRIMIQCYWGELEDRLIDFLGTERVVSVRELSELGSKTLEEIVLEDEDYDKEETQILIEFTENVINTLLNTSSLEKTREYINAKYKFDSIELAAHLAGAVSGRPIISLSEMKTNEYMLRKAFNVFKTYYNATAKAKGGMITNYDVDDIIKKCMSHYKEHEQREQWVIEGFFEFIMGLLPDYSSSTQAFKQVNNIFGWR